VGFDNICASLIGHLKGSQWRENSERKGSWFGRLGGKHRSTHSRHYNHFEFHMLTYLALPYAVDITPFSRKHSCITDPAAL